MASETAPETGPKTGPETGPEAGHEPTSSDAELIGTCRQASRAASDAFAALYRRHAGAVLAFLRALAPGDEHAARDALQETFLRFYRSLERFDDARPLRPWLFRIARNVVFDHKKKASARELPHEDELLVDAAGASPAAPPPEAASRAERAALLRGAVSRLPEPERDVFLLKHDQELSYAEVAQALGCSLRTAKYRMKSALERLSAEAERLGVGE
ncbi:MAG: RNA polymerase sigma factor [Planctomycetota bacterium]